MIKNITLLRLVVVGLLLSSCAPTDQDANQNHWVGAGTEDNPYLISTVEDVLTIKNMVNSGEASFSSTYFLQTCDLDFTNIVWDGIGSPYDGTSFRGLYNGGGHTIRNLHTPLDHDYCYGFFGVLGGVLMNLGLESGSIYGNASGALASHSTGDGGGLIINCFSNVTVDANRAGGIADNFIGGYIFNCISLSTVIGPITGSICTLAATLCSNVAYVGSATYTEFSGTIGNCHQILDGEIGGVIEKVNSFVETAPNSQSAGFDVDSLYSFAYNEAERRVFFSNVYKNKRKDEERISKIVFLSLSGIGLLLLVVAGILHLFSAKE